MFDPSSYKMTASADIEILDLNGNTIFIDDADTIPWTIKVCSPGVAKATKAAFEYKQAISGDLLAQSRGAKSKSTEQAERVLRADFLMKVTESTNAADLTYDGKSGMDALRAIYLDPLMDHVTTAVDTGHHKKGNFSADLSKDSSTMSAMQLG